MFEISTLPYVSPFSSGRTAALGSLTREIYLATPFALQHHSNSKVIGNRRLTYTPIVCFTQAENKTSPKEQRTCRSLFLHIHINKKPEAISLVETLCVGRELCDGQ